MDTKQLIQLTQNSLTQAMAIRSVPSNGLPIAFRSILLALGNKTILAGDAFSTHAATDIAGIVASTFYKVGDSSLESDIASMGDEPFPLITPYRNRNPNLNDSDLEVVATFKNRLTGSSTKLRYMMIQFSELGFEYMRNMKYFPKIYNITNDKEVPLHVKSHVPAELFRTTVFRTQGRGANMYPMNPAEIFYTMYEMLEKGYDIPVEELSAFRGFDLGNENISVFMKPTSLYSLFDIGITSFKSRINYEIDYSTNSVIFKTYPYQLKGNTFNRQVNNILKKNDYRLNTFSVDPTRVSAHISNKMALKMSGLTMYSNDDREIRADIESTFFNQINQNHYHFAHEVDVEVENGMEKSFSLPSRSVRETLIKCIDNFKEITRIKYQNQIDDIEEDIKVLKIYEKSTRDYIADHIHRLQRTPGRDRALKNELDRLRTEDPEKYPEFTMEEITGYIYVRNGNNILANLDKYGSDHYLRQINTAYDKIKNLKRKMEPENIEEEAKSTYLDLSKREGFKRKSPVFFVNSTDTLESREKLLDYVNIFDRGSVPSKVHYYGGSTIIKTSGENLPQQYIPTYTLQQSKGYLYQEGSTLHEVYSNLIPYLDSKVGYIAGDIRMIQPIGVKGIYLTNFGRVGIADKHNEREGAEGYSLLPKEHFIDFVPIEHLLEEEINKAGVVMTNDTNVNVIPLTEVMEDYRQYKDLSAIAKYDSTRAIEVVNDKDDLRGLYVWSNSSEEFIEMSEVNWDNLRFKVSEHYYPNVILSGNKKAYIDGIHIPIDVLKDLVGIDMKRGSFINYMEIPTEFKSYIAYISPNKEENSENELNDLRSMVGEKLNTMKSSGAVPSNSSTIRLSVFNFIRDI